MDKEIVQRKIYRYLPEKGLHLQKDLIVVEKSVDIFLNGQYYKSLLCSPVHLEELAIGHLANSGIINNISQVEQLKIDGGNIHIDLHTASRGSKVDFGDPGSLYAGKLLELMEKHLANSQLHRLTGGVHLMSLASSQELFVTREDIGRHNAVDKLYGYCLLSGITCADKIFLSSGRITQEIIYKISRMGIKVAASRAAVTSLALDYAEKAGITICGFIRENRFNIYSHPERVLPEEQR